MTRPDEPPAADDADAGAAHDADPDAADQEASADGAVDAGAADHESAYELLQRGRELNRGRHYAQAAIVLERAARLEPGRGSILESLGRAYFNSGQHDAARRVAEDLLRIDPSNHYAHFVLGRSLERLGRTDQARTHLRLAVALDPTSDLYGAALRRLPAAAVPVDHEDEVGGESTDRPEAPGDRG